MKDNKKDENEESKKLFLIVGISNRCSSRRLFLP